MKADISCTMGRFDKAFTMNGNYKKNLAPRAGIFHSFFVRLVQEGKAGLELLKLTVSGISGSGSGESGAGSACSGLELQSSGLSPPWRKYNMKKIIPMAGLIIAGVACNKQKPSEQPTPIVVDPYEQAKLDCAKYSHADTAAVWNDNANKCDKTFIGDPYKQAKLDCAAYSHADTAAVWNDNTNKCDKTFIGDPCDAVKTEMKTLQNGVRSAYNDIKNSRAGLAFEAYVANAGGASNFDDSTSIIMPFAEGNLYRLEEVRPIAEAYIDKVKGMRKFAAENQACLVR